MKKIDSKDLTHLRQKFGLSQVQFSELLGVPIRTYQDIEQGRKVPVSAFSSLVWHIATCSQFRKKVLQLTKVR